MDQSTKPYRVVELDDPITTHLVDHFKDLLHTFADVLKAHEVDDSSHPSAPNSSSFRALVSGKIETVTNYAHRTEYINTMYQLFIKVGSNIDRQVVREQTAILMESIGTDVGDDININSLNVVINGTNGYYIQITRTTGTAFSGVGLRVGKK